MASVVDIPIPGQWHGGLKRRMQSDDPRAVRYMNTRRRVVWTLGIGDLWALEAFMPQEHRDTIELMYYGYDTAYMCNEVFPHLKNYPQLNEHRMTSIEGAMQDGAEDICARFARDMPFTGSSPLMYRLCDPPSVPKPYAYVCPSSDWGMWGGRDFDDDDWRNAIRQAELGGLHIVSCCRGMRRQPKPPPEHPLVVDMHGRTTMCETIELLKGAEGYMGIDSWPSVLAAKLFPTTRMAVKSNNPVLYQWAHVYYAPRTDFAFVGTRMEGWDRAK